MSFTHDIVVIGTGFGGLCAAVRLKEAGLDDFVLLERGDAVGGTWRDNAYPGCACDVPSHLYSFSFAPNPDWTRAYATQPEIRAYVERCFDTFGVRPHVRLGQEVVRATWDEAAGRWIVETPTARYAARVLISATGALSNPALPAIPGLDRFAGPAFHSARWRHDVDLRGKRVAVVGTGASAIQFVPRIAPDVVHLAVFQRTPPWIVPRPDRAISKPERWLYRHVPVAQKLARWSVYWAHEARVLGFVGHPALMDVAARAARKHLRRQVADPALRAKLTPTYAFGCKRVLLSDDYYPALTRPNVEVLVDPIAEATPRGLRTASGRHVDADVLIHGTGFAVQEAPRAGLFVGRDGLDLATAWRDRMAAYKGTAVAGFPNLFLLLGPNTGLGHSSMLLMIEAQVTYAIDALTQMRANGWRAVEVAGDAQAAWNAGLDRRLAGTVWQSGCHSWYLDRHGHNTTLWPGSTIRFRRETARFDAARYTVRA